MTLNLVEKPHESNFVCLKKTVASNSFALYIFGVPSTWTNFISVDMTNFFKNDFGDHKISKILKYELCDELCSYYLIVDFSLIHRCLS